MPYTFDLTADANPFTFDGREYRPGDQFSQDDPCKAKQFIAAYRTANTNKGLRGFSAVLNELDQKCPLVLNDVVPPPSPWADPDERDPQAAGGDSAARQGAPWAPVGLTVSGTTTTTPSLLVPSGEEPQRPATQEPHQTSTSDKAQAATGAGDPIDLFSGAFVLDEADLEIPHTVLPLVFVRSYRSGTPSFGPFGWNWDHNFNLHVRELANGDIGLWRNLREERFAWTGAAFEPPRGVFEKLERVTGNPQVFTLTAAGGSVIHFERPPGWLDGERVPVRRIRDRHGNQLLFAYGAGDKLAEVQDDDGRFFRFTYDACGLLVKVTDSAGRACSYEHDEQTMHLTRATSPPITGHPAGLTRVYSYEQPLTRPELRHNIVRITDAVGRVYVENVYDPDPASWSYARVTQQYMGAYLFQFAYRQLQWVPANPAYVNIGAVQVEVLNPELGLEAYTFNYRGDLLDQRYRLNKDRSFRVVAWQYEFDQQGNLAGVTAPDGSQQLNVYDAANADPRMRGRVLRRELKSASGYPAPSRIIWTGVYETAYQLLVREKDERGAITKYRYDFQLNPGNPANSGRLLRIVHPNVKLPDGTTQKAVTRFECNTKGQITGRVDPTGIRTEFVFGTTGHEKSRLVRRIDDVGGLDVETAVTYDALGFEQQWMDGNGNATQYAFNALGLMEIVTLPPISGAVAEYRLHYNADRQLAMAERPKGAFVEPGFSSDHIFDLFESDVLGHCTGVVLSSNTQEARRLRVRCDFRGLPREIINPDGSRIRRVYDERGLQVQEVLIGSDGATLQSRRSYHPNGNLRRATSTFGEVTQVWYDGFSRPTRKILPNGSTVVYRWLQGDLLESEETTGDDGSGTVQPLSQKSYEYDSKGRKIRERVSVFAAGTGGAVPVVTTFFYDELDRPVKIVDQRGGVWACTYDGLGRILTATDAMGNVDKYAYDNAGNLVGREHHHQEPNGSTSLIQKTYTFDARNRRVGTIAPDGAKRVDEYDDRNLLIRQTDYLGIVRETGYNSFQNRIRETWDAGGLSLTHRWTVDAMSRAIAYVDPSGQQSTYELDGLGRLRRVALPNGFSSTRSFNAAGQLVGEELGSGVAFAYGYDAANRLTSLTNTAAPAPIAAVAPHAFRYDGLDRLVSAGAGAQSVVRRFDSTSRLVSEAALGTTLLRTYDDLTGTVVKTWPDGRTERHFHDLNVALVRVEQTAGSTLGASNGVVASFKRSGARAVGEASYGSSLQIANVYDERKRLTDRVVTAAAGSSTVRYRYDRGDRRRVEAILGLNPKVSYFEFDAKSRLMAASDGFSVALPHAQTQAQHDVAVAAAATAASAASHREEFAYNAGDERTKRAETGAPAEVYSYDPGHRIASDGSRLYAHHADGTRSSDGTRHYDIDALGRIVRIRTAATTLAEIEYDALGRPCVVRQAGSPARSLNYLGEFVEQESESGAAVRHVTVDGLTGMPIARHAGGSRRYPIFDGRYNLVALADQNGAFLETYRYSAFGSPAIFDAAGAPIPSSAYGVDPMFGGQQYLQTSGLYLSDHRLMDPATGLFLSPDPDGYADSPSPYVYAGHNPVDLVDPNGAFAFVGFLIVAGVGALVAGGVNAARQGVQIAEGSKTDGFSGWELLQATLMGAVIAPALVFAPEAGVPLALAGIGSGIEEMKQGHYATGAFDIVTSLIPFITKGGRNAAWGRGSLWSGFKQAATTDYQNLPVDSVNTRLGRFALVEGGRSNFVPDPRGREVGVGFARMPLPMRSARAGQGHVGAVIENPEGALTFFEKNGGRNHWDELVADFNTADTPPEFYYEIQYRNARPFEYRTVRVTRANAESALSYAQERTSAQQGIEPFDLQRANCAHFTADVLDQAGLRHFGNGRPSGVWRNIDNFGIARAMAYWTHPAAWLHPNDQVRSK